MTLSVSTIARDTRLTTVAAVQAELGISTDRDLLDSLIASASAAISAYCHRPFAREAYAETLPGYGDLRAQLARTPVIAVASVTLFGQVVTDYVIEDANRGWLSARSFSGTGQTWARSAWPWSAQTYAGLSGDGAYLNRGQPMDRQEEPVIAVAYTAGYILPSATVLAATISAAAADNSFNDSGSGFPSNLVAGDVVEVSGFATPANNGRFLVVSATTAKIVISGTLTLEAATPGVMVKFRPPAHVRAFDDVEKAAIETVKAWFQGRTDDSSIVEKSAGPMRLRYSETRSSEGSALPPVCVGLLRPWVRAA